ncbi:MAG: SMC-Scp complex subunit ScpB [Alicyclobacillaceae bacterium]|jgi:segregation and condensation protein B|uniref:SMC-Scp complex subunit ScpB n=1 Tax=Alicyclobacillus sp. SP_1 TaxID=2942475 RepID=UPI00215880ED|nr:SMC-Scp complex subunit ScpB [Alicyclobacillus sp. SP_1]MCY0889011.1 SMC-Scp complex subunit ScpB [Alicyclobacillaceae bacterium]
MLLQIVPALEAVLFAAGTDGLSTQELAGILQVPPHEVVALCDELRQHLSTRESGIQLLEVAGVWQLSTRAEHAHYLHRMTESSTSTTLSPAALETLAIVAYRQPITRSKIESIRGVHSDRALQTLLYRQLIAEVGRENAPGRPILYGTTDHFLQTFGLLSLADLPELPEEPQAEKLVLFEQESALPRD